MDAAVQPASVPADALSRRRPELAREALSDLQRLTPWRSFAALGTAWALLFILIGIYTHWEPSAWAYPFFAFLIAGRQGVLLQIMHEAAHRLLSRDRRLNDAAAAWFAAYPIGLSFVSYARTHLNHHAFTNEPRDSPTDTEKYTICDVRDPRLWRLFVKDLMGITALQILFRYEAPPPMQDASDAAPNEPLWKRALRTSFVQLAILWGLFGGSIFHYATLWIIPLMIPHMILKRVGGVAEHGLLVQMGVPPEDRHGLGDLHARSFLTPSNRYRFRPFTWIEKFLIGSLNVNYHHEHHLLSAVPFYNLPRLHALVAEKEMARVPGVYAKGYFSALFFHP